MRITEPWLIQRGTFKENLLEITGIDSIISWDYMGSAEFEWGMLPACLKGMITEWAKYRVYQHPTLRDLDNNPCYFICQESDRQAVNEVLVKLSNHEYQLKERSDFDNYINGTGSSYRDTNFWWALESESICGETKGHSQWMACFGPYISILMRGLIAIYKKKNETETNPSDGIALDINLSPEVHGREIFIEEEGKVLIIKETFTCRETVLVKKNILESNISGDKIFIKIKTRSGGEKWINIICKNEKRRTQLFARIIDQVHLNQAVFARS